MKNNNKCDFCNKTTILIAKMSDEELNFCQTHYEEFCAKNGLEATGCPCCAAEQKLKSVN